MTAEGSTNTIEKIGRYRVTGELGRGGMGVVYQGEDRLIGRRVAIKTLTDVTPELRERFNIEAKSGILSHQNIVTVYELGEHEGRPFIAMEFIEGDSLEKVLRARKRLPLLEALSIVEQLCAGLGYAHRHGVVHRDVKPANVLVRPDGRVTIVDFGIARLADQTRKLTETEKLLGTLPYIAPERLKDEPSDGRADIWSVGVMLYEMLTGELPFKGSDISSLYRVIHEPYVPLAEYVEDLPDGLSRVLDRALAKQVDARYATAEEMAFDLQVLAGGLKHDRVGTLLETARRLAEEKQYAGARSALLQAQRIDPTNSDTKSLLTEVQDQLSHMNRGEQLGQIIEQAEEAANGRRWSDAVTLLEEARKLDTENLFGLDERLQQAQKEKVQQQRVLALWKQADDARDRGDLTRAEDYLGKALQIDERSTDLRSAYSNVLREVKRRQQQLRVEELLGGAREESGRQRYTEAISRLREAAEIDPNHTEVQELLFSLMARRNEERRQQGSQASFDARVSHDGEDAASREDDATHTLQRSSGDTVPGPKSVSQQNSVPQVEPSSDESELEKTKLLQTIPFARVKDRFETRVSANADAEENKGRKQRETEEGSSPTPQLAPVMLKAQPEEAPNSQRGPVVRPGAQELERQPVPSGEIRTAIAEAAAACDDAIASGELRNCMRPFDDLGKQYGASPAFAAARETCESKRRRKATEMLLNVLQRVQKDLRNGSAGKASEALKEVEYALPFSGAGVRIEWQRLLAQCTTSQSAKQPMRKTAASTKRGKVLWYIAGSAVLIAAFAAVGLSHHRKEAPAPRKTTSGQMPVPAHAVETTDVEINASPWAKVVRVEDEAGKRIPLPDDQTTPLRLEAVNSGAYIVTLLGAEGQQQTLKCNVSAEEHLCSADLGPPDTEQVLKGEQP